METVQILQIEPMQEGQRLDNFLIKRLKGVPRSRVYRLIRRGEVRVNKKRCKPEQRLQNGDKVRIPPYSGSQQSKPARPGSGLEKLLRDSILLQTEAYLVLNKPSGLAVHGGSGIRLGLIEAMRQLDPDWRHLELVHRLDRDTSGCLLVAKNPIYLKKLQSQFKARSVHKKYLALVLGAWPDELQEINAALKKNELSGGERIVRVDPDGKQARSFFRIHRRFSRATLLEVTLDTGRTHQIRVHCQHAGYPIVGDQRYLTSQFRKRDLALSALTTLCLHAWKLGFTDPASGQEVVAEADLDSSFREVMNTLSE